MRKFLVAIAIAAIAAPAGAVLADPGGEPNGGGSSQFGRCIALLSGNGQKNGRPFQSMDADDCINFLDDPENRPGKSGDNGKGQPGTLGQDLCPPSEGPVTGNLNDVGAADPTGAVNTVICLVEENLGL